MPISIGISLSFSHLYVYITRMQNMYGHQTLSYKSTLQCSSLITHAWSIYAVSTFVFESDSTNQAVASIKTLLAVYQQKTIVQFYSVTHASQYNILVDHMPSVYQPPAATMPLIARLLMGCIYVHLVNLFDHTRFLCI